LSLRSNAGLKLANAFGVIGLILVTEELPEESDLLEITRAPSADKQMQAERQTLSNTKRTVH
jgi:hypothetical protein